MLSICARVLTVLQSFVPVTCEWSQTPSRVTTGVSGGTSVFVETGFPNDCARRISICRLDKGAAGFCKSRPPCVPCAIIGTAHASMAEHIRTTRIGHAATAMDFAIGDFTLHFRKIRLTTALANTELIAAPGISRAGSSDAQRPSR